MSRGNFRPLNYVLLCECCFNKFYSLINHLQTQAQQIIIFHPGSFYLRIGRASDLNPHQILHAVARRRKPGGKKHSDSFLPATVLKVIIQV